mmetsp:Transcript_26212/g.86210  ORF Transcript_26212/g.86210 Transcript_26212/m.86210 type:complete len:289 (-) Transcript_26212:243-1109(-)
MTFHALIVSIAYCISGSALTLLNRFAIRTFPFSHCILLIQCSSTILSIGFISQFCHVNMEPADRLQWKKVKLWLPITAAFAATLLTSLQALQFVTSSTLTVLRHSSIILTAFIEYHIMHTQFDLAAVLCLLGICLGALVYGLADLSFSISGYVWLTMNVIAISWYQVMMKNIASQKLLNTLGMTLYNNVLSVPLFMLQTIINKEDLRDASLSSSALGILVASAVCGTILSITAVAMNQYMTATSLMVLNHVNKFCLILLEHFLIEPTLTWISFAGTLQVRFLSIWQLK